VIGLAVDKATSAFHIPPEERKVFKEWLNRPDEFDCIIYWRQDRLVRRPIDFMGMVAWAIKHGKELYSATEGFGDVTSREGMLMGFLKSWQAEGESESISVRVTGSQEELAQQGRWRGGRIVYGAKAVKKVNSPGWEQVPDLGGKQYTYCREAVKRAIGR
jgi:DNA invertase Pin-like site-specific DNA recombinase